MSTAFMMKNNQMTDQGGSDSIGSAPVVGRWPKMTMIDRTTFESATGSRFTENDWHRLLGDIRGGMVVPVVGPHLLTEADGKAPLLASIARQLLSDRDIAIEPGSLSLFHELDDAFNLIRRHPGTGDVLDVYDDTHSLLSSRLANDDALPCAIDLLARITDFPLYATLTPDDSLARALRKHRGAVREIVHSITRAAEQTESVKPGWEIEDERPHVLYLFGKSGRGPVYALHEEDHLEYSHRLLTGRHNIGGPLAHLSERSILLIGCNFPDWLGRLFLRLTNGRAPLATGAKRKWVIDPADADRNLTRFLDRHSNRTFLLTCSPSEFVGELHARWVRDHAARPATASADDAEQTVTPIFFISYSRKADQASAHCLYDALLQLGAKAGDIWFDRSTVKPGNDFTAEIADGIKRCHYFLPLLSTVVDGLREGLVFTEWEKANERRSSIVDDFVVPIVVDQVYDPDRYSVRPVKLWKEKNIDFGFAPNGRPDARLLAHLETLFVRGRAARQSDRRAGRR